MAARRPGTAFYVLLLGVALFFYVGYRGVGLVATSGSHTSESESEPTSLSPSLPIDVGVSSSEEDAVSSGGRQVGGDGESETAADEDTAAAGDVGSSSSTEVKAVHVEHISFTCDLACFTPC